MNAHRVYQFCWLIAFLLFIGLMPIYSKWMPGVTPLPEQLVNNLPDTDAVSRDAEFKRRIAEKIAVGVHIQKLNREFSPGGSLQGFKKDVWGRPPDQTEIKYYEQSATLLLSGGREGCNTYAEIYWTDGDEGIESWDSWVGERECLNPND